MKGRGVANTGRGAPLAAGLVERVLDSRPPEGDDGDGSPITRVRLAAALIALLEGAWSGRTVLLVSHRLLGMEKMDEILFLENGEVVERERHQPLETAGGKYARSWRQQQLDSAAGTAGGSQ